ncbi:hypothetical protein YH62_11735 [Rhizobium sp. LC145]|nr:hypothetical protein YH62_11735 [Rhizobium sp. LC145]
MGLVWRHFRRFFHRLLSPERLRVPTLPDDLREDLGLSEAMPESREAAFWEKKRGSIARDVPL